MNKKITVFLLISFLLFSFAITLKVVAEDSPVDDPVPVVKTDQTITFNSLADKDLSDSDFDVSATATSGLVVTFSTTSTSCTVSPTGTIHIVAVGSCEIVADQAGDDSFNSAPTVQQSFTIVDGSLPFVTISATPHNKVYDGTTNASVDLVVNDALNGDTLTATGSASFTDSAVGTNKTIHITGITLSGTNSSGYNVNPNLDAAGDITTRPLTVTVTANNKVSDGNTTASVHFSTDKLSADTVTVNFVSATFSSASVGNGKTVTVSGLSLSGRSSPNYFLTNTTLTTTANITAASSSGGSGSGAGAGSGNTTPHTPAPKKPVTTTPTTPVQKTILPRTLAAVPTTPPDGCLPGFKFSPVNGLACPITTNNPVSTPASLDTGKVLGAESSFTFTLLLKQGSKGNEAMELQKFLNANGFDCGVADGIFGAKTKAAVILFQKSKGLGGDGVVGPKTRAFLNS